ncbi:hemolymph lipopolysaccharide-binding protein-like [Augochlora pura]
MSSRDSFVNRVILVIGLSIAFDSLSVRSEVILNKYFPSDGRCYKLHTAAQDWPGARRACIKEGAHLAVINDTKEANTLKEKFHNKTDVVGAHCQDAIFVGIHDQFDENDWITIFDEPIASVFHVWTDHWGVQPDNYGGKQNCGSLYRDGRLNDVPCTMKLPFFCEKTAATNGTCPEPDQPT